MTQAAIDDRLCNLWSSNSSIGQALNLLDGLSDLARDSLCHALLGTVQQGLQDGLAVWTGRAFTRVQAE